MYDISVEGALQAQFYASKVKVTVVGTVTPLSPSNPRLDVNLRHLGTPAVVSTSCEKYTFTHNFRDSTYSYNVLHPTIVYSDDYLSGCGSGTTLLLVPSPHSWLPATKAGAVDAAIGVFRIARLIAAQRVPQSFPSWGVSGSDSCIGDGDDTMHVTFCSCAAP